MPMPYIALRITNVAYFGANALNIVHREKYRTQATRGRRRPKRSASEPKISAPTGRIARAIEMVQTMALFSTWKLAASVSTRRITTKKSKASNTHPRIPAETAYCHPDVVVILLVDTL